jgi:hypothetical protein
MLRMILYLLDNIVPDYPQVPEGARSESLAVGSFELAKAN